MIDRERVTTTVRIDSYLFDKRSFLFRFTGFEVLQLVMLNRAYPIQKKASR